MRQATFALACVMLWSLQTAVIGAQDEDVPAKPVPQPNTPAEPTTPEATTPPPVAQPAERPPVADANAAEAMRQTIARLQTRNEGPTIDDICEVKHYEKGKLHGFGLVLDLEALVASWMKEDQEEEEEVEGKEEAKTETDAEDLVEMLKLLNQSMTEETPQKPIMDKLQGTKHLTVVAVSAEIPPEGVRQGERINCQVKSIEKTTLENGYLLPTRLSTQAAGQDVAAGVAAGRLERGTTSATGTREVAGGCLVKTDISDQFTQNNKITLVLDEEHAKFAVAQDVVDLINVAMANTDAPVAKALNRYSVEVAIPAQYQEDPVAFITRILRLPAPEALTEDVQE